MGIFSHFYNAVVASSLPLSGTDSDSFLTLFSTFSYIAGLASVAGVVGVLRRNPRLVKIFSTYAFAELALSFTLAILFSLFVFTVRSDVCTEIVAQPEMDPELDMDTCLRYYDGVAIGTVVAIAVGLLLRLHFAMAIRAYYVTLRDDNVQYFSLPSRERFPYFSYPVIYTALPNGAVVDEDMEEGLEGPPAYEEPSKNGLGSGDIKL
jgi:uncharacterized protein with PQ loop repeat